jgi:hypothetical protein
VACEAVGREKRGRGGGPARAGRRASSAAAMWKRGGGEGATQGGRMGTEDGGSEQALCCGSLRSRRGSLRSKGAPSLRLPPPQGNVGKPGRLAPREAWKQWQQGELGSLHSQQVGAPCGLRSKTRSLREQCARGGLLLAPSAARGGSLLWRACFGSLRCKVRLPANPSATSDTEE